MRFQPPVALAFALLTCSTNVSLAACDFGLPVATFSIEAGSMLPTLAPGSTVFATCFNHATDAGATAPTTVEELYPELSRGAIVALRYPRDPDKIWISRMVAVPGDRVQMRQGQLHINGQLCPREADGDYIAKDNGVYMVLRLYHETLPNGVKHDVIKATDEGHINNTPEFRVPPGHVFVMGDNRDNAADSRFMNGMGFIPISNLVAIIYAPPAATDATANNPALEKTLEKLRNLQKQTKLPKTLVDGTPIGGGNPQTDDASLSAAQRGAIGDFVRRCWATDPYMLDLDRMTVSLIVTTDASGVVRRAIVTPTDAGRMAGNTRLQVFAERAIRAISDPNCANLPLPQLLLGQQRTFTFRFRP